MPHAVNGYLLRLEVTPRNRRIVGDVPVAITRLGGQLAGAGP